MDKQGKQPLYRPKPWERVKRPDERKEKKTNWYRRRGDLSVVFVPASPGWELKKKYEECIRDAYVSIKVVEKSVRTIKTIVQKSDPFGKRKV